MNLGTTEVLKVVRPLYGIPESGMNWDLTYIDHHLGHLGMERPTVDSCLLYKRSDTRLQGLIILQVDDSLGIGSDKFLREQEAEFKKSELKKFISKPTATLSDHPTDSNGIILSKSKNLSLIHI